MVYVTLALIGIALIDVTSSSLRGLEKSMFIKIASRSYRDASVVLNNFKDLL